MLIDCELIYVFAFINSKPITNVWIASELQWLLKCHHLLSVQKNKYKEENIHIPRQLPNIYVCSHYQNLRKPQVYNINKYSLINILFALALFYKIHLISYFLCFIIIIASRKQRLPFCFVMLFVYFKNSPRAKFEWN